MRRISVLLFMACLLFGCSEAPEIPEAAPAALNVSEDVSITYHTTSSANVYGITLTNHLSEPVYFWPNAYVEKRIDDQWYEVPILNGVVDSDVSTILDANSSKYTLIPFNSRYGEMESGTYRISYAYADTPNASIENRQWLTLICDLEFTPIEPELTAAELQTILDEQFSDQNYQVIEPIKYLNGWHYHIPAYNIEMITELDLKDIYVVVQGNGNNGSIGFYYYEEVQNEGQEPVIIFDSLIELVNVESQELEACNATSSDEEDYCRMEELFMRQDGSLIASRAKQTYTLNEAGFQAMSDHQIVSENGTRFMIFDEITFKDWTEISETSE